MVIRGVEVEEQHLFRAESFELVPPYLVNVQARDARDIAEPELLFIDQAPQLDRRAARICRAERLQAPCRAGNRNVRRASDRYKMCEQTLADKRHVAREHQRPIGPGSMNGGIQRAER